MLMILEIIQAIENDEEREKVEMLFHQYYKFMMARAKKILHNHHDAEDAVMETFRCISENVKIFMNLNPNETAALISICTRNMALNMYKHKQRQQGIMDISENMDNYQSCGACVEETPQSLVVNDETVSIVHDAIRQLDEIYRDVIVLKYFYHLKNVDISHVLRMEQNTVNSHIFRAKQKLKDIIGEEGYERIAY